MFSIVLLTFNCATSVGRTLRSVRALSDDIHVVDSYSSDNTVAVCESFGCKVVQRRFVHYADQRNWAIDNLDLKYDWQLHLDADEELEAALAEALARLDLRGTAFDGFIVGRKIVFLGKVLRFGGIAKTWHCRLFRRGFGRCEDRLYDQHFVCRGRVGTLDAFMLDHQEATISEWTQRHNRWSDLECDEMSGAAAEQHGDRVASSPIGNRIARKRFLKDGYYRLPLFARAFAYFGYRYLIQGGFLDGMPGLIYHVLQGLWFRFLVDAKLYERRLRNPPVGQAPVVIMNTR